MAPTCVPSLHHETHMEVFRSQFLESLPLTRADFERSSKHARKTREGQPLRDAKPTSANHSCKVGCKVFFFSDESLVTVMTLFT
jgi:hypothetical protein